MLQSNSIIRGKSFVVTGALRDATITEVSRLITSSGGIIHRAVNPFTDYVVLGENPDAKIQLTASMLRTTIIGESTFRVLLNLQH